MEETRIGAVVSAQIARMGTISFTNGKFKLPNNDVFNIKNDGPEAVTLEVQLACMAEGDFIETVFEVGWNPEIVRVVKDNGETLNIKYGI